MGWDLESLNSHGNAAIGSAHQVPQEPIRSGRKSMAKKKAAKTLKKSKKIQPTKPLLVVAVHEKW
jgi:hypothetical protein